jgi:hypothetical protein
MNSLDTAGNYVIEAADELVKVLNSTTEMDWKKQTPTLNWNQEQTAIHTMRACLEYSYQVVGGRMDTYQPVLFDKKEVATPVEILKMISTAARVLERVVKTSSNSDRAWHAYGVSDPVGFAAMGVVEISVHTYDLAKGFGIDFVPLKSVANFAVSRLFTDTVEFPKVSEEDAGELLLWCAGRIELAGLAQREGWKWNGQVR